MYTPNPGSTEAREAGCRCPVIDNHYGRGDGPWWINEHCPIHNPPKPKPE